MRVNGLDLMMNSPLFPNLVKDDLVLVEERMRSMTDGRHPNLKIALDHLIASGGKRIRPSIVILIGRIFNTNHDTIISLSSALELLHTATLVHDDLIDGSLLRRGIPTLNASWSSGATVLTGDFLFGCAALLAAETSNIEVIKLFAKTVSILVNGEVSQIFATPCKISRDEYYQRIYAKTASLFETTSLATAKISGLDEAACENFRKYGYSIGMAFQIVDDILDFTGQQATVGKPVGNDLRLGLVTLPTLYFVEKHCDDADVQTLMAGNCLKEDDRINRLIHNVQSSDSVEECFQEAEILIEDAIHALDFLPNSVEKEALVDLARYIVAREK